jgi:hypothetical protein
MVVAKRIPEPAQTDKSGTLRINGNEADREKLLARTVLRPTVQAALSIQQWARSFGESDLSSLVEELKGQAATASSGNLARAEAMLVSQAHTLDAIFHDLSRRACRNKGEYLEAFERYLRLALKAQSQCRTTLETLAEIKNPRPVAFVKQQNIAAGPQQVNNGAGPPGSRARDLVNDLAGVPRAGNPSSSQNELLEHQHEPWLDPRAPGAASGVDSKLEPVASVDGTTNGRR